MSTGTLKIHSENLLPIIKKWLYSDRDIFVRELVSNATDAIQKLKILREKEGYQCSDAEFCIDLKIDKDKRTLTFSDTGLGMDKEEVEKYISQLAFSGAEDFIKKYETKEEAIIGHFGLGFYSAFMVADQVDIQTLSYKENAESVFWTSDGSTEYRIDVGSRATRGTEITLHVNEDNKEFLDPQRIREILTRYSQYLPIPITLNGAKINDVEPLWLKAPSECTDEEYLQFYRHLNPMKPDPLFWIHLNVDYPFRLQGILYFPKMKKNYEMQKNSIKLFCNRVFVTDQCQDLIPEFLTMLEGCIDSPDIPLNVSRSSLQMDRTVRQLASHISKKVSDRLNALYQSDKEKFIKCWDDVELIAKLGIVQDEKFYDRIKSCLVWKTLQNEWTTVEEYLERNTKTKEKIFYLTEDQIGSPFTQLYQDNQIEVLISRCPIDSHIMGFLEGKLIPNKFMRIDGEIYEGLIDSSKENTLLDAEGKTAAGRLAESFKEQLSLSNVDVEAKSLASTALPAFLVIEEEVRRMREYFRISQMDLSMMGETHYKLVVNTNHSLIRSLEEIQKKDKALAKEIIFQVYDLARLNQRELDSKDLHGFTQRMTQLLEKLAAK